MFYIIIQALGIPSKDLKIIDYKMNSLILLHNKYHLNSPKKNDNDKEIYDFNDDNKNYNSIQKDKEKDKININNSYHISNSPNNIFDLSYLKNKNAYNNQNESNKLEKLFHTYRKPTKRTYNEAFSKSKSDKNINNNDKNNTVNLNINNNNYFYINNNVYNVSYEEEYGIDITKNKILKE